MLEKAVITYVNKDCDDARVFLTSLTEEERRELSNDMIKYQAVFGDGDYVTKYKEHMIGFGIEQIAEKKIVIFNVYIDAMVKIGGKNEQ